MRNFDQIFCMSVLEAIFQLRHARVEFPEMRSPELIALLRNRHADFVGLDFESAADVIEDLHLEGPASGDFVTALRELATALIKHHKPSWLAALPRGRQYAIDAAPDNAAQVLRGAGLLCEPPTQETISWWDSFATEIRAVEDQLLLLHGREAEELSLNHEKARVKALGITGEPRWIAIDDNSAGYDILSFDPAVPSPTNLLIEVKGASDNRARFFLSRHEWNRAEQSKSRYEFHVWLFPSKTLRQIAVDEMRPHIPTDHGNGSWDVVEVALGLA